MPCQKCLKERMIDLSKFSMEKYLARSPYCRSCKAIMISDKISKGWFKKGNVSWNIGTVGLMPVPWNKDVKGIHLSPKTEFTSERMLGKKNFKWKGDSVGYYGLHTWIYRSFGKADKCDFCDSVDGIEWANKTYKYLRNREDWLKLCVACHRGYDRKNGWGRATKMFPELRSGGRNA